MSKFEDAEWKLDCLNSRMDELCSAKADAPGDMTIKINKKNAAMAKYRQAEHDFLAEARQKRVDPLTKEARKLSTHGAWEKAEREASVLGLNVGLRG